MTLPLTVAQRLLLLFFHVWLAVVNISAYY